MATNRGSTAAGLPAPEAVPPLREGDRLDRDEFERRYEAMPDTQKAELIDGVVYIPSSVYFEDHGGPHFDLILLLGAYRLATPGIRGADNTSHRLDLQNEPQPDVSLFVLPSHGGRVRIEGGRWIVGGPELIAEVAAISAGYDLNLKKAVYQRNGVREYLVWRVLDRAIDWFVLRADGFEALPAGEDGIYRSEALPGLWLDSAALIAGDVERVAAVLRQGLSSPEHADFVARLEPARAVATPDRAPEIGYP
jgi:Putative restriction endonuclease